MTEAKLIADWIARGNRVSKVPRKGQRSIAKPVATPPRTSPRTTGSAQAYRNRFDALVDDLRASAGGSTGQGWSVEQWARYEIQPCDPLREIAEAAALVVIARDEGTTSARLFEKHLCANV